MEGTQLSIYIPGRSKPIQVPLNPTPDQLNSYDLLEDVEVWADKHLNAYALSKEADAELSLFLDKPVRLVFKGPAPRPRPSGDQPSGPLSYEQSVLAFQGRYVSSSIYSILICRNRSISHPHCYPTFFNQRP
jgi:hypothetical protein